MTTRNFDDRLSDWLEDGPVDAPDRVLDTILAAFPSIPQRRAASRVRWTFPQMNGYTRALAAIAAVIAIAIGGLILTKPSGSNVGGPNPSPTASTSPSSTPRATPTPIDSSTWVPFTSSIHGITVSHPADWAVAPATVTWPRRTEAPPPPNAMLDAFTSPDGMAFVVVSQAVPHGTTTESWLATYEREGAARYPAECWPAPALMERVSVAGEVAWIHGEFDGCGFTEAIVFAGGRVYELTGYADPTMRTLGIFDRLLFDAFLSTVRFEPAKAAKEPGSTPEPQPVSS